ncbi:MAG: ATP-binding protein, partial [Dolichospermum sp.]
MFSSIATHLQQQQQIIVCYGQRRIGKSSVLRNIPHKLRDLNKFVFVAFSLEYYSQEPLGEILADLARQVVSDLSDLFLDEENIKLPEITDLESNPQVFFNEFLLQIYQLIGNKNIVFSLDEFDVLLNNQNTELFNSFNEFVTQIISSDNKLFFILFIDQKSKSLNNLKKSEIFRDVPVTEIGLLNESDAKKLIIDPAKDILQYEENAIETILNLSAGHPYFTQVICFAIFSRARENDNCQVNKEDVEKIINKVIELAEAGLAWFWDGFSIPEKIVFSAIAESQETSENYLELITRLTHSLDNKLITETEHDLRNNGFLDETEGKVNVKLELVRLWIIQRHPLRKEIHELDQLNFDQKKSHSDVESYYVALYKTEVSDQNNDIVEKVKISEVTLQNPKLIILAAIATLLLATLSLIISSILLVKSTQPCPAGEKKEFGVFCVADTRISRGERTLFPLITNIFRDQGIQAFKRENYQQAANLFKQATQANRNDPEVVIYYNNALARQAGSPLTLAVVVRSAEWVLRGVAQAQ